MGHTKVQLQDGDGGPSGPKQLNCSWYRHAPEIAMQGLLTLRDKGSGNDHGQQETHNPPQQGFADQLPVHMTTPLHKTNSGDA